MVPSQIAGRAAKAVGGCELAGGGDTAVCHCSREARRGEGHHRDHVLLEGGKPVPVARTRMCAPACARTSSQLRCILPGPRGDAACGAVVLGLPGAVGPPGHAGGCGAPAKAVCGVPGETVARGVAC